MPEWNHVYKTSRFQYEYLKSSSAYVCVLYIRQVTMPKTHLHYYVEDEVQSEVSYEYFQQIHCEACRLCHQSINYTESRQKRKLCFVSLMTDMCCKELLHCQRWQKFARNSARIPCCMQHGFQRTLLTSRWRWRSSRRNSAIVLSELVWNCLN